MPEGSVKILLIEDNLAEARLLQEFLKEAQFRQFSLVHVKRLRDALQEIAEARAISIPYDVILLDLTLPDSHGLASLGPLIKQAPSLPIVVLTNTNDDELAIEAVRQGAQDYLVKRQVKAKMLVRSLRYAIERKQAAVALRQENQ
ncbi:MAG: response regulator, partial [Moorea sp. SIO3C2]|nr:response regulator [Moorena sp. SIO3C2]